MAHTKINVELVGGPLDGIRLPMSYVPPALHLEAELFCDDPVEMVRPPEKLPQPRVHRYKIGSDGKYHHDGCVSRRPARGQ